MGNLSRTRLWAVIVILVGALAVAAHLRMARAQIGAQLGTQLPQAGGPIVNGDRHSLPDDIPYATHEIQERQMKRLRQEHQEELIQDTTRLVQLATTLKAEVDKENSTHRADGSAEAGGRDQQAGQESQRSHQDPVKYWSI